jgi:hypothetical protein
LRQTRLLRTCLPHTRPPRFRLLPNCRRLSSPQCLRRNLSQPLPLPHWSCRRRYAKKRSPRGLASAISLRLRAAASRRRVLHPAALLGEPPATRAHLHRARTGRARTEPRATRLAHAGQKAPPKTAMEMATRTETARATRPAPPRAPAMETAPIRTATLALLTGCARPSRQQPEICATATRPTERQAQSPVRAALTLDGSLLALLRAPLRVPMRAAAASPPGSLHWQPQQKQVTARAMALRLLPSSDRRNPDE